MLMVMVNDLTLLEIQVAPLLPLQAYASSLQAMTAAFREIDGVLDKIEPRHFCVIGSERFAQLVVRDFRRHLIVLSSRQRHIIQR